MGFLLGYATGNQQAVGDGLAVIFEQCAAQGGCLEWWEPYLFLAVSMTPLAIIVGMLAWLGVVEWRSRKA